MKYIKYIGIVVLGLFITYSCYCFVAVIIFKIEIKKASNGDPKAQVQLGNRYRQGKLISKNYDKALEWYLKAAEQGDANAQYNLAVMYLEGLGVTKDYKKAYQLNITAAKLGIVNAEYNLGITYLNGLGVPKIAWRLL